jgi:hypothetical protein
MKEEVDVTTLSQQILQKNIISGHAIRNEVAVLSSSADFTRNQYIRKPGEEISEFV